MGYCFVWYAQLETSPTLGSIETSVYTVGVERSYLCLCFCGPLQGSCVSFCCVYYDILPHSVYSREESCMFRLAVSSQKMHSAPLNLFHTMAKCFSICPLDIYSLQWQSASCLPLGNIPYSLPWQSTSCLPIGHNIFHVTTKYFLFAPWT